MFWCKVEKNKINILDMWREIENNWTLSGIFKITSFWDIGQCVLLKQTDVSEVCTTSIIWVMRQYESLKRRSTSRLQGALSQKVGISILGAVRTWNFTVQFNSIKHSQSASFTRQWYRRTEHRHSLVGMKLFHSQSMTFHAYLWIAKYAQFLLNF
jgi:hypothetical protein